MVRVKVWVCSVESMETTTTAFVAGSEQAMLDTLREQWGNEVSAERVPDEDLLGHLCDDGLIIWTDCQWVDAEPDRHAQAEAEAESVSEPFTGLGH